MCIRDRYIYMVTEVNKSTEANKASVRRWIEAFNQRNLAVFDELTASNWTYHDPGFPNVRTLEDYKQWLTQTRSAFPNFHVTIDDMIAEGDTVVVRQTLHGTNTGDIVTPMPLPATGKKVTASAITIVRFAEGKGVEVWNQGDNLGIMQQLGVQLEISEGTAGAMRQVVTYLGAGIYEEALFRLALYSGMVWLLRRLEAPKLLAVPLAAVASATLFSAAHHLGPYGQPYDNYLFLFRLAAGLYFAFLYQYRGFGVAVGAHACYNLMVSVGVA